MAIIGHSKFIPVFLGNIVRKRLEQTFLAIPNLYQSFLRKIVGKKFRMAIIGHSKFIPVFWETLSEKDWNKHFWPFLIYTSLSGENCWKKFGTTIFGHSKLIPVLLGKIVRKRLEQAFLAIPIPFWPFLIYTSLLEKNCWKKFKMAIFGHNKFIPVLLGKIVKEKLKQPFWEKLSIPNNHFWPFLIYTSLGKNLGNIVKKQLKQPFLALPNLYQSFWEKDWNKHFWPFLIYTSLFQKNCQKKIGTTIFGHS